VRYDVIVDWDDEAKVWYVTESNVPGLTTEAPTLDAMVKKLETLVPEMLEENGFHVPPSVPFYLLTQRQGNSNHTH
jgi:hypothetical protein